MHFDQILTEMAPLMPVIAPKALATHFRTLPASVTDFLTQAHVVSND